MTAPTPIEEDLSFFDEDTLTPLQYMVMDTLGARHRTGEKVWTLPHKGNLNLRRTLDQLTAFGLIGWKYGIVENTVLAWLTDFGLRSTTSESYRSPLEQQVSTLTTERDAARDALRLQSRRLTKQRRLRKRDQRDALGFCARAIQQVAQAKGIRLTGRAEADVVLKMIVSGPPPSMLRAPDFDTDAEEST